MNTIIHTPTPNLETSISFYEKLNFKIISKENPTLLLGGGFLIEINSDHFARAGIKLYKKSWEKEIAELAKLTTINKIDNGFILSDPSGAWIYLMESVSISTMKLLDNVNTVLGNFAGISLETTDFEKSVHIWNILGFEKKIGGIEQGWIALKNEEGMGLSLMKPMSCPHLFFNPSLTFFNGKDNPSIIEKIRKLGIPISEEITHFNKEGIVDNIIIRDPGGYGFFIFND